MWSFSCLHQMMPVPQSGPPCGPPLTQSKAVTILPKALDNLGDLLPTLRHWLQTYPCTLSQSTPAIPLLCCSLDLPTRMFFTQWQPGNKDAKPWPENVSDPWLSCVLNVRSFHPHRLHSFICLSLYSFIPSLTYRRCKLQICRNQQVIRVSDSALTVGTTQGSLEAAKTEQKSTQPAKGGSCHPATGSCFLPRENPSDLFKRTRETDFGAKFLNVFLFFI